MSFTVPIQFIGARLILFGYLPEMPLEERLSWKTFIMKSRHGTEQRQSLVTAPKQVMRYVYSPETVVDKASLRNVLIGSKSFLFGVPEWWDMRLLTSAMTIGATVVNCDTINGNFYVGGPVMLKLPNGGSIDSLATAVTSTTVTLEEGVPVAIPLGSVLVPLRFCYINGDVSLDDELVEIEETQIEFQTNNPRDVPFTEGELDTSIFTRHPLDNLPVLLDPNMVSGRHGGDISLITDGMETEIGLRIQFPGELASKVGRPKEALADTFQKIWQWRRLVGYLRGSWRSFYLPTFREDLPVNTTYNLNSTTIVVKDVGLSFATMGTVQPYRSIMIKLSDGRVFLKQVTATVDNVNGTWTISIDTAPQVGSEIITAANIKISWLVLSRVAGDVVTFRHVRPGLAIVKFNTVSVQQ
jgi:hypothetical protein